jgi:3-hydroxyisobutyrate dehydrogenase-like beta-hydroxyacid dehydrogenase
MTQPPHFGPANTAPIPVPPASKRSRMPIRFGCVTLIGFLGLGVVGIIVLIILIAGGYIFTVSNKAAHQTSPTAAADSYLDATLNARNLDLAKGYMCDKSAVLKSTKSIINQLKGASASISYSWTSPKQTAKHNDQATVEANVTATTIVNGSTSEAPTQTWTFNVVNQSGWKVCGVDTGG